MPSNVPPMPTGQLIGATSSASMSAISSSSSNGGAALAVDLVDEGDDRHRAQPADLEQFARLRLDALGGVDHHHRGIDRGQRAIGVLGEILVARRVEQVEGDAVAARTSSPSEVTEMPRCCSIFIQSDRARRFCAARLDLAGEMDRAAEQQQLLGQRGLAGVGVRDDREGAAVGSGTGIAAAPLARLQAATSPAS